MNNKPETQSIEWTVATDEESQWLVTLADLWQARTQTGWQFVTTLRDGIDAYSKRRERAELYELVANQTSLAVKTLMNYVSLARNPNSTIAQDLGLDIAHAETVLGLEFSEAEALLTQAAEQSLSANAVGAIIRESKKVASSDLPAVGNERHAALTALNHADEPPFARSNGNVLYDDYDTEADALAGSSAAYDFGDDDTDAFVYSRNEVRDLLETAWRRLPADNEQRTVGEWLTMLSRHTY